MNDQQLPLRTLLYRFFFFGWLFKEFDENATPFERGLVKHHNRQQAQWLPTYMFRWLWCSLLFYAIAGIIEMLEGPSGIWRTIYAMSAGCVTYAIATITAWVTLRHRPDTASE